jgi:hypothetical protein
VLEELVLAVPGGAETVDVLAARLAGLGLVGWVVDGATLGHDGWVVARVIGDDEGALATGDDGWQLLEPHDLRAALAGTWPEAQVGEVVVAGQDVVGPLCQSGRARLHEVAFATARGMGLDLEAAFEKLTLASVRVGTHLLFSRVQPIEGSEHDLLDVFTTARGGSVVLWRREPYLVLQVMRRSVGVELHVWGPAWTPFGPDGDDDGLRAELGPERGDAAEVGRVLGLPDDAVRALDEMMRADEAPALHRLCRALGLPDEAALVLSGECAVEELPGAVVHGPLTTAEAFRVAMRPSEDDPAWVRWLDEGAREVRPWYVASSLASAAYGAWLVSASRRGGSRARGRVGVALVLGTAVDLPVRWWLRDRRPGDGPVRR